MRPLGQHITEEEVAKLARRHGTTMSWAEARCWLARKLKKTKEKEKKGDG